MEEKLLQCYNRGCGQKYHTDDNSDNSCRHHPGEPFFHDAYKGWSCCNRKCTDFTEFLNMKGCTVSKHSNVKPPEPEKPIRDTNLPEEAVKVKPIVKTVQRPRYDTPLTTIIPDITPSLKQQVDSNKLPNEADDEIAGIPVGTSCKNNGCTVSYQGTETDDALCIYHPGVPIFHEGLKFWSCCQKRTTDFDVFLSQVGCDTGKHLWKKDQDATKVDCRWDHHQTNLYVIVSIYAKDYCPTASMVKLSPIRLCVNLVFPRQSGATFNLDFELCGVIDVSASMVTMYGTKVEIKLKKANAGIWNKLEIHKPTKHLESQKKNCEDLIPKVESVDLGDL